MENSPIFVTGFKRSGTTLLGNIIDRHPRIAVFVESFFIPRYYYTQLAYWPLTKRNNLRRLAKAITQEGPAVRNQLRFDEDILATVDDPRYPRLLDALMASWAAEKGKARWGDKTPGYINKMSVLNRMYPDAKFVHIIRDGRNVWTSLHKLNWESNVALVAREWQRTIRTARRFAQKNLGGRYLEVSYEALVADSETELRDIMAFLGEDYCDELLNPSAGEGRNKAFADWPKINQSIDKRIGSSWLGELPDDELAIFESVAADGLTEAGYRLAANRRSVPLRARAVTQVLSGKTRRAYEMISRRTGMVFHTLADRLSSKS